MSNSAFEPHWHADSHIWDAREHLRQTASFRATGLTETNGYGRVNEQTVVDKLLAGSPVEFQAPKARPAVVFNIPFLDHERAVYAIVPHTTALRGSRF